ncbi:MAG: hypothetical protein IKO85_05570 [Bacteroidaceae bacterium]|nr:hypothetical protein [Bacteroidaceae bacterium]
MGEINIGNTLLSGYYAAKLGISRESTKKNSRKLPSDAQKASKSTIKVKKWAKKWTKESLSEGGGEAGI